MSAKPLRISIHRALLLYLMIGVILPVMLFGSGLTFYMGQFLEDRAYESAQQATSTSALQLDSLVHNISYTASYFLSNDEAIEDVCAMVAEPGSATSYMARMELVRTLRSLGNIALYTFSPQMYVITPDGTVLGTNSIEYLPEDDLTVLFDPDLFGTKYSIWKDPLVADPSRSDLTSLWTIRHRGEVIALLKIVVPDIALWNNVADHPLLQHKMEIIRDDHSLIASKTWSDFDQEQSLVFKEKLTHWDMYLLVSVPKSEIEQNFQQQIFLLILLLITLLIVLLIVISYVSRRISRPILQIEGQMQRLQEGHTDLLPVPARFSEVHSLSENLLEVANRIDGFIEKAQQDTIEKETLYYESLMAQIKPHFLYNTLNSIKWMAVINNNTQIASMVSKLGNHMLYSFDRKSTSVSVENELAFLEDYFSLQQLRFGSNIVFRKDIPPHLLDRQIPKFILQPFVENAFSHGLEQSGQGVIELSLAEDAQGLLFTLKDNGTGTQQEKVNQILAGKRPEKTSGVGIYNVHRRLQLLYNNQGGVQIITSPGRGFTVMIRIPA